MISSPLARSEQSYDREGAVPGREDSGNRRRGNVFANVAAFLFEYPVRLLVVAGVLQFLLICLWSRRRSLPLARAVRSGFLAMPALAALSVLVVTDRERVIAACESLAQSVERGDLSTFAAQLGEDFHAGEWDRSGFLDRVRRALQEYKFHAVRLSGFEFRESNDAGVSEVDFDASCRIQGADVDADRVFTRWRLRFQRQATEWRVTTIEPIPTPFSPIRGWRSVPR